MTKTATAEAQRYEPKPGEDLPLSSLAKKYRVPLRTAYEMVKAGHWSHFVYKLGKLYVIEEGFVDWVKNGGELGSRTPFTRTTQPVKDEPAVPFRREKRP